MGGNVGGGTVFVIVMVGLAILMLGTFILRPVFGGGGSGLGPLIYGVRIVVMIVAMVYGMRHPPNRGMTRGGGGAGAGGAAVDPFGGDAGAGGAAVSSSDPFADSAGSASAGPGPKIMEFNWSTTQPAK